MNSNFNNVFDSFTKSILSTSEKNYRDKFQKSYLNEHHSMESTNSRIALDDINSQINMYSSDFFIEQAIKQFRELVGKEGKYKDRETIGTHPDFTDLEKTDDIENHYIVSMFVDIKNSTSIYLKTNDLAWTKFFKNTVLRIITIFMRVFDGHIHRLQGDAVFSFFGWKDKCEEDAIIDSLNAASFLLYYIENRLNQELENDGLASLKIRIGIDFGKKDDVLWSEYGLNPATEVTTTSLHTDLAAKLQNKAPSNGILIGNNIKEFLDLPDEFLGIKTYQKNHEKVEDKYILEKPEKRYRMWIFKHQNYLKYFPYLHHKDFNLLCQINEEKFYYPNLSALEKEQSLKYIVENAPSIPEQIITITDYRWSKENRGNEAREAGSDGKLKASRSFKNTANEGTSYRGHHIMKCEILKRGKVDKTLEFGIFIK